MEAPNADALGHRAAAVLLTAAGGQGRQGSTNVLRGDQTGQRVRDVEVPQAWFAQSTQCPVPQNFLWSKLELDKCRAVLSKWFSLRSSYVATYIETTPGERKRAR